MATTTVHGPLEGITVVDMSVELVGPYATQLMADLGANVIKVEALRGDGRRTQGPFRNAQMSSQFLQNNRGKRSIAIDLKDTRGRETLLKLCETADVFVYNSRREAMKRLGLTYEDLSRVNPKIVYCGVSGYGEGGPYQDKPAYDETIQGLCALPALQARLTNAAPNYLPVNLADRNCALFLMQAILAALPYRARTGEGQAIELPMFETLAAFVLSEHMWGATFEPPLGEPGAVRTFQRRPARTLDGYLCYILVTDDQVTRFWDATGRADLKADERFSTRTNRNKNIAAFYRAVESELEKRTTAECIGLFERADLPAMPLHDLGDLIGDPHLRETGFFRQVEHPTEGTIVMTAVPTRWSKSSPSNPRHAPLLGEHTTDILDEAGLAAPDIQALIADGIVRTVPG